MENITEMLVEHKKWLKSGGKEGIKADLCGTNLRGVDLCEANLSGANLCDVDLRGADLCEANLSGTNLCDVDLRGANLRGVSLKRANLCDTDLRGANIDFACWPLWCGSLRAKVDERIARQLLYHAFAVGIEFFPGGLTEDQKTWLQKFEHATDEVNSKM